MPMDTDQLRSKQLMSELKVQILQTVCFLLDDEVYSKQDAAMDLLNLLPLIDVVEGHFNLEYIKQQMNKTKTQVAKY